MKTKVNRREFIQRAGLAGAGIAGVVFGSGLRQAHAVEKSVRVNDFFFLQMSDTHWGFTGPAVNPDAAVTLEKAVATVNGLERQPDFIVFTGDLTHTTDDAQERRTRLAQFRDIVGKLNVKDVRFMAGEHDASLDPGRAYHEFFRGLHYTFDHQSISLLCLY